MTCKCTAVASMPEKPVPPGGKDKVVIRYDVSDRRGSFSHTLYIQTNDTRFPLIPAVIAGNSTQQLFIKPGILELTHRLDKMGDESACSYIRYTGDWPLELSDPVIDVNGAHVSCQRVSREMVDKMIVSPHIYKVDHQHLFVVTARLDGNEPDPTAREGKIRLKTNLERYPIIEIPVTVKTEKPVYACPSMLYLGEVQPDAKVWAEMTLVAARDLEFIVDSVSTGIPGLDCTYPRELTRKAQITFSGTLPAGMPDKPLCITVAVPSLGRAFPIEIPIKVWCRRN